MKSLLSQSVQPFRRIWQRYFHDDRQFRRAKRASSWIYKTFTMSFSRNDYATILRATRISKQGFISFAEEAALERARFILQVENSGRRQ